MKTIVISIGLRTPFGSAARPTFVGLAIIIALAAPAYAWDGPGMWYRAADDANPGGGGILVAGTDIASAATQPVRPPDRSRSGHRPPWRSPRSSRPATR